MKLKRADGSEVETTPYMTLPGAGRLDLSKFQMVYEPPQPENVVRNADGTPYQAGADPEMKRFLLKYTNVVIEGVIFSDGMIVINGDMFHACQVSSEDVLRRMFPKAVIQRLD